MWAKISPPYYSKGDTEHTQNDIVNQWWNSQGLSEDVDDWIAADTIHNPFLLEGMFEFAEFLYQAIQSQTNILVFGDYDADGVTSSWVMWDFLKSISKGSEIVYGLPNRETGYGINPENVSLILELAKEIQAEIIVIVDSGVTAKQGIAKLSEAQYQVVVLDHHEYKEKEFPDSVVAIVDPKIPGNMYPHVELSAVGLVFKFIQAYGMYEFALNEENIIPTRDFLERAMRNSPMFIDGFTRAEKYSDVVALGMIADVMSITDIIENRSIIKSGMERLCSKRGNLGLLTLATYGRFPLSLDEGEVTVKDIAFSLAPVINACGRLYIPDIAFQLLDVKTQDEAEELAKRMQVINTERKELQKEFVDKVNQNLVDDDSWVNRKALIVVVDNAPPGILGLIATSLSEKYQRPALVLHEKSPGLYSGSARTARGISLKTIFQECDGFLQNWGGHHAAAGVSIKEGNLVGFLDCLDQAIEKHYGDVSVSIQSTIHADVRINLEDVVEAWTCGNLMQPLTKPMTFYTDNLSFHSVKTISGGRHLMLSVYDGKGNEYTVMGWNMGDTETMLSNESLLEIDMVYEIEKSSWPEPNTIRLNLLGMQPSGAMRPMRKLQEPGNPVPVPEPMAQSIRGKISVTQGKQILSTTGKRRI